MRNERRLPSTDAAIADRATDVGSHGITSTLSRLTDATRGRLTDGPRARSALTTRRLIVAGTAVVLAAAVTVMVTSSSTGPSWHDEFSGAAGSAPSQAWGYQVGGNGWGINELECYTDSRDTSALDGHGHLVITALSTPHQACGDGNTRDYSSARLSTQSRVTTGYGRIRIRAMMPSAPGVWPALWALGDNHDSAGWPQSGEIDISEVVGKLPSTVHGTLHGPKFDKSPYSTGVTKDLGQDVGDAFHVYGIDWSPAAVTFSVDGTPYGTVSKAEIDRYGTWVFDHPFYLLMNVAVGGNWPGAPTAQTQFPQRMIVDYVRIYAANS